MNSINCIDEACYFLLRNAAKPGDPRHLALILIQDLFDKGITVHRTLNVLIRAMRFVASIHLQRIIPFRTGEKTQGQFFKIADSPAKPHFLSLDGFGVNQDASQVRSF